MPFMKPMKTLHPHPPTTLDRPMIPFLSELHSQSHTSDQKKSLDSKYNTLFKQKTVYVDYLRIN